MSIVILKGDEAIHYAAVHEMSLNRYASDSGGEQDGLSVEEANKIAEENPGLIWVEAHLAINTGEASEE